MIQSEETESNETSKVTVCSSKYRYSQKILERLAQTAKNCFPNISLILESTRALTRQREDTPVVPSGSVPLVAIHDLASTIAFQTWKSRRNCGSYVKRSLRYSQYLRFKRFSGLTA